LVGALSDRAKRRLQLLAGLLRSGGMTFDVPRDRFYDEVQKAAAGLSVERQAELKELVNWLEDYERGAQEWTAASEQGRAPRPNQRRAAKAA
jgi:hypothetical protein